MEYLPANDSVTGRAIFAKDWSETPLGAIENWPQSMRAALQICLVSDSPASMCWGDDLFFFYNDAWRDLFDDSPLSLGQPARQGLGRNWSRLEPHFEDVLKRGEPRNTSDQPLTLSSKEEQNFYLSVSPIFDEQGHVEGIFNITKPGKSTSPTERLQQAEQEFYDFFEHAPIGLHWLGPDGTILRVNKAELDMLGYAREEYVGRNITEFYVDGEFIEEVLQSLHEGEVVHNYEAQMARKDGSIVDISLSSNALRKNGKFVHTRCFTRDLTGQKRSERRFEESEQRYRTLVDNFPKGAVGLFDESLRYIAVGGELLSQVGIAPEDRIGNKITDVYPEEIIREVMPYFQDVFKGKANTFEAEFHNRHLHGQTLPIKNNKGEIISGMLVVQDITKQWRVQQELHKSEAKFRMMAENLNEIIWMISEDQEEFIYINPAFEKVWGIDREKLFENPLYFLNSVHPDDRDRIRQRYTQLPKDEFDDEYRIIRPDGQLRWLHARGSKVSDKGQGITRIIGFAEDITQRKRAEQQLRKSTNRLRTALNIDTVGVLFWEGEDLKITEANNAFLNMSGYAREELLEKSWRELTPEKYYQDSEKAIADIEATGRTQPYEKQYIRKDGTRWWGLFAPRKIDGNEVVEFVLDITDRKEAQQKLEELNQTLEERVKKRTQKLRSYQEQLRLLASQLDKTEERERQRLATELHDTLGQKLTLANMKIKELKQGLSSHQPSLGLEEVQEIVQDALKYNQNLMVKLKPPPVLNKEDATEVLYWTANKMIKKGLDIEIQDDGQLKPVDREIQSVLYQSVRELFQNIIRHAGTDRARLEILRENEKVKVTVEDKGEGFDTKSIRPVPSEGRRFGLFNIQERMDWHGGMFEIYSDPGKGTKAILYVPLKEGMDTASQVVNKVPLAPDPTQDPSKPAQKIKVLLVDDHKMVRRGFRQMIEKQDDIEISGEASHGREAVQLAQETAPDIILMDVNMPVMDGIEATKRIKDKMPFVRIIGLSLHKSQEVIDSMRNAGASAYITKDEAFESLIAAIRAEIASN